jgi:hypothetical protein
VSTFQHTETALAVNDAIAEGHKFNADGGQCRTAGSMRHAIELAQDLLREADAHTCLRAYQEVGTHEHERLGHEIHKCLVFARVAIAQAMCEGESTPPTWINRKPNRVRKGHSI